MSPESIKRVALYTRVSTEDQAEHGYSLGEQLDRLKAFIFSKGWTTQDIYREDGHSGRTIKRPEYQRMMANKDLWDAILVMKMDRIHRNSKNFMEMMDFLAKNCKEFVSMMESLDTSTAMGRFFMDMTQRIAQLESEQIGERTYLGMRQKAKILGVYNGHLAPYGYRIHDHKLVPDPAELAIVKMCFEEYDKGAVMRVLCEKTGLKLSNLQYILRNPIYAGFEQWCYIFKRAQVTPIVSIELFNRVQQRKIDICPGALKRGLHGLKLLDIDNYEIPLDERKIIPGMGGRAPKHKMNY